MYVTPEQALMLASLTPQGQKFYADARSEGTDHDLAYADAVHSYGVRKD